jgi:histone deacetylase 6
MHQDRPERAPSHQSLESSLSSTSLFRLEPLLPYGKRPRHQTVIVSPDSTPFVSYAAKEGIQSNRSQVGLVFEAAARHINQRLHKERPSRITCIRQTLQETGILDHCSVLDIDNDKTSCQDQSFQNLKVMQKIHSKGYLNRLQNLSRCTCLQDEAAQYNSIYLTKQSWESAFAAISSLCHLLDSVLSLTSPLKYGFACIRPPGHHAQVSVADGFCLINNVAVAAQFALDRYPKEQKRIAIIDWDIHHGNGTQSIFWNNSQVLYCSIHLQQVFPFNSGSGPKSVGGPQAMGKNVNLAWSSDGMGDEEYLAAMQHLIIPIVQEFQPNLILISAGFDAAKGDVGNCCVTPRGFGQMTRQVLSCVENCPVVASLEGGYKHSILGNCVSNVVQSMAASHMLGAVQEGSTPKLSLKDICPTAAKNIQATRRVHQPYWKCCSNHENK